MPVSEDQRALLRLLVDGADYDELSGLLGTTPDEVAARARKATDELKRDDGDQELAEAAERRLSQLEGREPAAAPFQAPAGASRRFGPVAWLLIAGGVIAVVVVLIVIAGGGGSGDSSTTSDQSVQEDVVTINLSPVGGGTGHGTVRIVRVADRPAVDLDLAGLRPTGAGETYVLALVDSRSGKSLPVAFRKVGPDGRFTGRSEIADAASGLLPDFDTMELSLAQDQEAAASVQQAARNATLPTQIGTPVLHGNLPKAGAP